VSNPLQRTEEWFAERAGKITASEMSVIVNGTIKGWKSYMRRISSEQPGFDSAATAWGREQEARAVAMYELQRNVDVELLGFKLHPTIHYIGGSVDGLLPDRTLEIKCPYNPVNHISTLVTGMPKKHYPQVQSHMWICEKDKADFVSFDPRHPDPMLRLFIQTIPRDDHYIGRMERQCAKFWEMYTSFESESSDEIPKLF